jgi:hypothetical protein
VQRLSKKTKLDKLMETIRHFETDPAPGLIFARRFLYYDVSGGDLDLASSWHRDVIELSTAV